MKALCIIKDPPHGSEQVYDALGSAHWPGEKDARGSTMNALAAATIEADEVVVF